MTKTIHEILHDIQVELKAPKNQYNSFGKYKYRSCEDILEGVKPLLPNGCNLTLQDNIVEVGGRVYVQSIATLTTAKSSSPDSFSISATAFAREPAEKKGMDASQITGTASSYARKYALNGLFCIDDTKDADSNEAHQKATSSKVALPKKEYNELYNEIVNCDDLAEPLKKLKASKARMSPQQQKDLGEQVTIKQASLDNKELEANMDKIKD